jgi:phospholipid/cholesterol/gamma-HCH transport system substrate-binding protein
MLKALLDHAGSVLATVSGQRHALGNLVSTAASALSATAADQAGLAATIARAPGTLAQLRSTLQGLDVAGAALRPAAQGLRTTAPALTATLRALPGFTTAALPALAEIRLAAPDLTRLGVKAAPVIARLRPTAVSLAGLGVDANALTNSLDLGAADILGTLENWARAIQSRDGLSHEFRVSTELTPTLIKALMPLISASGHVATGAAPPTRRRAPSTSGAASQSPAAAPKRATATASSPPPAQLRLPGLPPVQLPVPQATGSLQHLLSYLLGK